MSESTAPSTPQGEGAASRVLLFVVTSSSSQLDDIITTLLDMGMPGATVIETKGLGAILRQEMPIFAGLASLIPDQTGSRVVLSVSDKARADKFFDHIESAYGATKRPLAFSVPVDRAVGLRR